MATIRDVAKLCGVSTATVSNVLNARTGGVSPDTRTRVLAAVRKLGYRLTALEKNQEAIVTHNIALICGDLSPSPLIRNHYLHRVFDGMLEGAALNGRSLTIFVERMWSDAGDAVRRSYDGRCDGVLALAPLRDGTLLPNLVERGIPVVSVGTTVDLPGVSSVDIDNMAASGELVRYLVSLGHRRIAYYGPDWSFASSADRLVGLHRAMARRGLADQIDVYLSGSSNKVSDPSPLPADAPAIRRLSGGAPELVREAFDGFGPPPTAIICWNEDYAHDAIEALVSQKLRIPEDVSVVGFDDTQPRNGEVGLTTMRQPLHMIGLRAVDMLIGRIESPGLPDETVRFKAELVVRRSSGPASPSFSDRLVTSHLKASLPTEVNA